MPALTEMVIKKLRRAHPVIATSMDGKTEDIPGYFKEIFSNLYNSANDKDEVLNEVEDKIDSSSLEDVKLVTPDIVKKLLKT